MPEVISITPNGQILTFSSIARAKGILLDKFHQYIIPNPQALQARYTLDQIQWIMKKHHLNPDRFPDNHSELCLVLWPQFIMTGRRTIQVMFGNKKDEITVYYLLYRKNQNIALDQAYLRLPRQAKALVDLAIKHIPPSGLPEHKWWKIIQENKEVIVTKADPWQIWVYYRARLLTNGFLTTIM